MEVFTIRHLLYTAYNIFKRPYALVSDNHWFYWPIQIGIAVIIFLAFFLLRKFLTDKIGNTIKRFTKKSETKLDDLIVESFEGPLRLLLAVLGLYIALRYLPLSLETDLVIHKIFRTFIVFFVAMGFYNLAGNFDKTLNSSSATILNIKIDKILLPVLTKALRFIIIAIAIVVILQEWNYDITGLVAGLGLGGLAFALAAQQTLANLFGGVVIITDKPFTIGDWILTPSVEGTVEDINFRSTKIRTFAQALVTVPNSTLANEPITNWSRMGKRRISFNLGVPYNTPKEKLARVVNRIKTMLQQHKDIHPQTIMVSFDSFDSGRYNLFLYFFTKTTVWAEYVEVKEAINLEIIAILEDEGISLTPPSSNIILPRAGFPTGKEK